MKFKILLSFLMFALVVAPVARLTHADAGEWQPATAQAAWDHGEYRVERLMLNGDAPQSFGDAVLVVDKNTVYQLKNGMQRVLPGVSRQAFDTQRFALNDQRLAYVHSQEDGNGRYNLVEYTLSDGTTEVLAADVFFNDADTVDARVDGDDYFFHTTFTKKPSQSMQQAVVSHWDHAESKAHVIGDRWKLHNETIEDVHNGVALVKMTFESGHKELWLMDSDTKKFVQTKAIPGTWTQPHGDIVGAHFRADGTVEYFQYFTRHTYDPNTDAGPVKHDETITWYRDIANAFEIEHDRLAWIDAEDTLFVSTADGVVELGTAHFGNFNLNGDRVFYEDANGGTIYNLVDQATTETPFYVTDVFDHVMVGNDKSGNVMYWNVVNDRVLKVGFGSMPVIADPHHVYWEGEDGGIYEATVSPASNVFKTDIRAIKTADSPKVYLVSGETRHYVPNENVFFSWFDSWADVETVSRATMNGFTSGNDVAFAPGTKVKLADDPKVYLVGDDGKLHWIVSQTVAYRIFGNRWNTDIIEVDAFDLVEHARGAMILQEDDLYQI